MIEDSRPKLAEGLARQVRGSVLVVPLLFIPAIWIRIWDRPQAPIDLHACARFGQSQGVLACDGRDPLAAGTSLLVGQRIDLNTATEQDLLVIPGIGPALARRIVERRRSAGAFRTLEDLDAVPGIGPKTIQSMSSYVTVGSLF